MDFAEFKKQAYLYCHREVLFIVYSNLFERMNSISLEDVKKMSRIWFEGCEEIRNIESGIIVV